MEGATMSTTIGRPLKDSYLKLLRQFPLRALRSERDYDRAGEILQDFFGRNDLDSGQRDYVDALALLVEVYDRQHFDLGPDSRTPLQRLKYLLDQSGTTPAKLGEILGSRSAASMILHGRRDMSRAHIYTLAKH